MKVRKALSTEQKIDISYKFVIYFLLSLVYVSIKF